MRAAALLGDSTAGTSSAPWQSAAPPSPSRHSSCSRPKAITRRWFSPALTLACRSLSQFVIAGAAIGVVAPAFKDWHKAFWDNLATTIQLHRIKKVIAIDHRDCGAAKIAYGEAKVANPQVETETHRASLAQFRKEVAQRHPQLGVQTGLMALDGKMEMFS